MFIIIVFICLSIESSLHATDFTLPGLVFNVFSGDIDADNDNDIIINTQFGVYLMRNDSYGTFSTYETIDIGLYTIVGCCQLDNQEGADLLLLQFDDSGYTNNLKAYFNGDFAHSVIYPFRHDLTAARNSVVANGDFNNDGYQDIVISGLREHPANHAVWCYMYNLGNHFQFSNPVWVSNIGDTYKSVVCADFNEDNLDDLGFINQASYVYFSTGTSFYSTQLDNINYNMYMVTGDFDNDGDADIATNAWDGGNSHHFRFYENVPGNSFTFHDYPMIGYFSPLYSADLNNDSYTDMLTMPASPDLMFGTFINQHNWTVQLDTSYLGNYGEDQHYCTLARFDNNNSIDIAIIRYTCLTNNVTVLFNDGTGDFGENPVANDDEYIVPKPDNDILCYPNPCTDYITFMPVDKRNSAEYYIYNLKGQLINHSASFSKDYTWNLKDMATKPVTNGIYIVKAHTEGQVITKKFIVNNR
jgi:hypothetical protein